MGQNGVYGGPSSKITPVIDFSVQRTQPETPIIAIFECLKITPACGKKGVNGAKKGFMVVLALK